MVCTGRLVKPSHWMLVGVVRVGSVHRLGQGKEGAGNSWGFERTS